MKKLYKMSFDCGRMGEVTGLFVAETEELEAIIGKKMYFGEVLGKHSEISGTLENDEISSIELDEETIEKVSKAIGSDTWSGYNPLEYLSEDEDEDEDDLTDEVAKEL